MSYVTKGKIFFINSKLSFLKINLLFLFLMFITGCAGFVSDVSMKELKTGMTKQQVIGVLGEPKNFFNKGNTEQLVYLKCIEDCWRLPNYQITKSYYVVLLKGVVKGFGFTGQWQKQYFKDGEKVVISYCNKLYKNSNLDIIRKKVPVGYYFDENLTFSMKANEAKPTKNEKKGLLVYGDVKAKCRKFGKQQILEFYPSYPESLLVIRETYKIKFETNLLNLYNSKISYSDFLNIFESNRNEENKARERIRALLKRNSDSAKERAREFSLRERIAADQARIRAIQVQQQYQNKKSPMLELLKVNKSKRINCTSTKIGNTVSTDCY